MKNQRTTTQNQKKILKGVFTMTRKNKKIFKLVTSVTIAMVMVLITAIPVFAAGNPITGNPAQAAITKIFKMPVGTDTPEVTFTFDIIPIKVDGVNYPTGIMPDDIDTAEIPFTIDDEGDIVGTGASAYKVIIKETASIFDDFDWPHAGEYVYKIKERQDNNKDTFEEKLVSSQAEYEIHLFVRENAAKDGYYVYMIADYIVVTDPSSDGEVGDKIDPTPKDPDVSGEYSEMMFTNTYIKNNGGTDPKDPDDTVFKLSKEVTGELGDTTMYFNFDVKLTKPALVTGEASYIAYVMDENNDVIETGIAGVNAPAANVEQDATGRDYIRFDSGVNLRISLKHGQWLSLCSCNLHIALSDYFI